MKRLKQQIIKFSKKLNSTNLSTLRSGNISIRAKEGGVEGFYITPSGRKYSSLKTKDIVFVSLKGIYDKKKENLLLNGNFIKIFMCIKMMLKQ
tara:strand:- start:236 stop:514 length:279 start_codon:yes stop_codon:yes gene_type:complete